MKPLDILDALSDLPEDYAGIAVRRAESQEASAVTQNAQSAQEEIVMKKQPDKEKKQSSLHFGKAGIAAAVAVCIGLNAALIYGIRKMKASDGFHPGAVLSDPAEQDETLPHMEVVTAMPTGVFLELHNPTGEEVGVSGMFSVYRDGARAAECEKGTPNAVRVPPDSQNWYYVNFPQLPAGEYTLYNLTEDGNGVGAFGGVNFEISTDFESMVWIPNVRLMQYEEAKALLEEKGVSVTKKPTVLPEIDFDSPMEIGCVYNMEVQPYKSEEYSNGSIQDFLYSDGKGYWVNPGDTVSLTVISAKEGEHITVPDVAGKEYEGEGKETLKNAGLMVDECSIYDQEVPEGCIIRTEPAAGTEVTAGSYVKAVVSKGAVDTVIVPNVLYLDRDTALQTVREVGLLPGIQYFDAEGDDIGKVTFQSYQAGEEIGEGCVMMLNIGKAPDENPLYMSFDVPENLHGIYYIYVRDAQGEVLGVGYPFKPNGYAPNEILYPVCSGQDIGAEAVLVNYETMQEAVIGSYTLHPDAGTYDTVTEDVAAAFHQVQE